jgi:hypothetical protein
MIQCSSAAGGALRPNVSSAKRKQPMMPSAGSVSVPSKSTRSALRRVGSAVSVPALRGAVGARWRADATSQSSAAISEGSLGGKRATG